MHRIRRGKLSSIAPTARHPNIEPPVWKGFRKWLLTRIVIRIPIDSYAVGVQGKLRARGDLSEIEAAAVLVQAPLAGLPNISSICLRPFGVFIFPFNLWLHVIGRKFYWTDPSWELGGFISRWLSRLEVSGRQQLLLQRRLSQQQSSQQQLSRR